MHCEFVLGQANCSGVFLLPAVRILSGNRYRDSDQICAKSDFPDVSPYYVFCLLRSTLTLPPCPTRCSSSSLPLSAMPQPTPRQPPRPAHGRPSTPPTPRTSTGPASGAHSPVCYLCCVTVNIGIWCLLACRRIAAHASIRWLAAYASTCGRFLPLTLMHQVEPRLRRSMQCVNLESQVAFHARC